MLKNYVNKKNYLKVDNTISLFIYFRNMLYSFGENLIRQLDEYIEDSELMRIELNSMYYIYDIKNKFHSFLCDKWSNNFYVQKIKSKFKL